MMKQAFPFSGLWTYSRLPAGGMGSSAKVMQKGDITIDINSATRASCCCSPHDPATAEEIVQERKIRPFGARRTPAAVPELFPLEGQHNRDPQSGMSRKMLRLNSRGCSPTVLSAAR